MHWIESGCNGNFSFGAVLEFITFLLALLSCSLAQFDWRWRRKKLECWDSMKWRTRNHKLHSIDGVTILKLFRLDEEWGLSGDYVASFITNHFCFKWTFLNILNFQVHFQVHFNTQLSSIDVPLARKLLSSRELFASHFCLLFFSPLLLTRREYLFLLLHLWQLYSLLSRRVFRNLLDHLRNSPLFNEYST